MDGRCQRAKLQSVKDHEGTITHKAAANLQMNQSDMKEAVKTAILQHDHVLLNLTSIILSMANNHDSLASFSARRLAAEMLSVEVKTTKTLFPNAELNLLSPGSGCPQKTWTGHEQPRRAPGRF